MSTGLSQVQHRTVLSMHLRKMTESYHQRGNRYCQVLLPDVAISCS